MTRNKKHDKKLFDSIEKYRQELYAEVRKGLSLQSSGPILPAPPEDLVLDKKVFSGDAPRIVSPQQDVS